MKITIDNFMETVVAKRDQFYKATSSGTEVCTLAFEGTGDLMGVVYGPLFSPIRFDVGTGKFMFDSRYGDFYTSYDEAAARHRELVLLYLDQLNQTSLLDNPIVYEN